MANIILALTKGRILKESLPLLAKINLQPLDDVENSRKLIFDTANPEVRLLILRGIDVPTYVQFGSADMGVVGKDILMEQGGDGIYEPLDLGIARCRLMAAGIKGAARKTGRIQVATKYVNIAREYYASQGQQADIIKLYGAMELAPVMQLADEIVDVVDTGNTLKANGLEPIDTVAADISSRLIVNKAAMKLKHGTIQPIVDALADVVKAAG